MADPSGRVVVCGIGAVGLRTVEQLHAAGVDCAVVDAGDRPGPVTEHLLRSWGLSRFPGRLREALVEAGIGKAAAVAVVPDDDLAATEAALLVQRTAPGTRLVVRVENPAVGRALTGRSAGGAVLGVAAVAAPSVVEACLGSVRPRSTSRGPGSWSPPSSPHTQAPCAACTGTSRRWRRSSRSQCCARGATTRSGRGRGSR